METLPADFPLASAHVSIAPHVVYRTFATETVILNLQTGRYHGLNKTGGRMLELLERADSVAAALAEFASGYGRSRWRSSRTCARSAGGSTSVG